MRRFVWGFLFGAALTYALSFHGHRLQDAREAADSWRNWAVGETKRYGGSEPEDAPRGR